MTAAYLYGAVRTTFGRFNGALAGVRPDDLASYVIKALHKRHPQLDGGAIDEAITVGVDETRQPVPGRRQHSGVHSPRLAADQQADATRVDRRALTGVACVSRVYTDYGVFLLTDHGVVVRETYGMSRNDLSDRLEVTLQEVSASSS
jgi:acetyl-CoA acetyltransferase